MPNVWIEKRSGSRGSRYRVRYRLGGSESAKRYAGSFTRTEDALTRSRWIAGELAAMRVPNIALVTAEPVRLPTVRELAERWKASRIDVSEGTLKTYDTNLERILPTL